MLSVVKRYGRVALCWASAKGYGMPVRFRAGQGRAGQGDCEWQEQRIRGRDKDKEK